MAGQRQSGDLSLVPYSGRDNNEIVLRHNNALVVYDAERGQLVLRGAPPSSHIDPANCPLCRRPLRDDSHEPDHARPSSRSNVEPDFINPEYFRMLQESSPNTPNDSRPPSPRRRLAQPIEPADRTPPPPSADVEFVSSSPASPPSPQGISSSAFSQGYFKRFFVEEGELGRGGKGVVLLVKHVLDGVSLGYYACKRVPVGDDHEWLEKVLVEVQLLQHLSHQNLVSYRHVWLENAQLTRFGPSVPCAFMLQQYCNQGDLHNYVFAKREKLTPEELKDRMRRRSKGTLETPHDLNSPRRLSFDEIYSFFRNITSGLSHLHANGFIHRDLKPSNCLLHDTGKEIRVLVSDFGEVQSESTSRKSSGATGTISYCAPEVLRQKYPGGPLGDFTAKSDIFSLGMILYFMCFGRLPYDNADALDEENEDLEQLRQEIDTWSGFDDEMPARSDLPEKLYRFLKRLLSTDPTERPTADDILRSITTGGELKENSNLGSIFEDIRGASRISPIDSPSPGTPTGLRGARNASTSSTGFVRPGSSKLRTMSYSQDRRSTSPSHDSPDDNGPSQSILVLRKPFTSSGSTSPHEISRMPHLLPPPSESSRSFVFLLDPPFVHLWKVALFCLKILSVTTPCFPLATSAWIFHPLVGLAAVDFALNRAKPTYSLMLLVAHFLVVILAGRMHSLCASSGGIAPEIY